MVYSREHIITGARFINLDEDYGNVKLIVAGVNPDNENRFSVIWYNFPSDPTVMEFDDFKGTIFPDLLCQFTSLFGRYEELRAIYVSTRKSLEKKVYKSPLKKVPIAEIIQFYVENCSVTQYEATALIKLSISKGQLVYEVQKQGNFLRLNSMTLEYENKKRFLQAIGDEIVSKSERIELLVNHSVTKGNYREQLLRSIIQKYLPAKYTVATGFIEGCNRQCDILIYDTENFSPLFSEGELVVVPEKSVRAVIEVKSTLSTKDLNEAMDLLWEVARHRNNPAPFFKGIFAFSPGYKTEKGISQAVCKFYHSSDSSGVSTKDILHLYETINAICVLNEQCIISDLIDYKRKDYSIRPRFYSIHSQNDDLKLYCASFFNELFSFLDVDKYAKKVNINYFDSLDYEIKYREEMALHEEGWMPQSCFTGEHDFTLDTVWKRVSDVLNWKTGNLVIQDLEEIYFKEEFQIKDYRQRFTSV